MTEEIDARDMLDAICRAGQWLRIQRGLDEFAPVITEFEEEFDVQVTQDDRGLTSTLKFNTAEAYTFFMMRWS